MEISPGQKLGGSFITNKIGAIILDDGMQVLNLLAYLYDALFFSWTTSINVVSWSFFKQERASLKNTKWFLYCGLHIP